MYYAANMSIVMLSIFLSGLVINISRRGERKQMVPSPVKVVNMCLCKTQLVAFLVGGGGIYLLHILVRETIHIKHTHVDISTFGKTT